MLSLIKRDGALGRKIYWACVTGLWRERSRLRLLRAAVQARRHISAGRFFSVFAPMPHKLRMLLRHGIPTVD
jgi:hypothetical protein